MIFQKFQKLQISVQQLKPKNSRSIWFGDDCSWFQYYFMVWAIYFYFL